MSQEQYREPLIVAKFGGTSVTRPYTIRNAIISDRPAITVVSAVGRTESDRRKLTDLLIEHEQEPSNALMRRMIAKLASISTHHVRANLHELHMQMTDDIDEYRSNGWALDPLGEKWTAERLAGRSGASLLLPRNLVQLNSLGALMVEESCAAIRDRITPGQIAMVPGYFGHDQAGNVRPLGRGGSDITGALFARALGAFEYHNWTDANGVHDSDPNMNPEAQLFSGMSYDEYEHFADLTGCQVLHPSAAKLLNGTDVVTVIRNTHNNGYRGTAIMTELIKETV